MNRLRRPSQQMTQGDQLGHLVRRWGVDSSQIPPSTATPQELCPFLHSILLEAVPFISDLPPPDEPTATSSWKYKSTKRFPHSVAPVQLFERTVSSEALHGISASYDIPHVPTSTKSEPETWYLRRSVHDDAAADGTAAWDEWVRCFKIDHAGAEKAFTPSVMSTSLVREWDCGDTGLERESTLWGEWTLKLEQSTHKMPAPLHPRVFPVLQATTAARGRREFLVVQIAVVGGAEDEGAGQEKAGRKDAEGGAEGAVKGVYTSVERVRELEPGRLEWIMTTVSDAKGVLPGWVQKLATPGAVAKDVDMFLGWIAEDRRERRMKGGG